MKLLRNVGLVDLAVATVVFVMVVLPEREMYTSAVFKGDDASQFAVALAEARTLADPSDGAYVADFARQLGEAGYLDWAIEVAVDGAERAASSPTEWRALLAASMAYVDRIEVVPALDYANRALTACRATRDECPSWEEVRMTLYQQHLDAGVSSGIDPRRDPKGFRAAGESALRSIRLKSRARERDTATPRPTPSP